MSCQEVLSAARALQDRIVAWRRDFHKHPELGFQETRTSGIVAEELERLGLAVRRRCPRTAVWADLVVPGAKDFLLLRADMDALPVQENSGEPFASVYAGKAHLCGHDSHVAMLLGAANVLTQLRDRLRTNVRFMFQPSEEATPGGAEAMIAEGVLDGVTEALAIHVFTAQQAGRWGLVPGPVMAATDALRFVIKGRGGHAATPEMCVDPIVAAAQLIMNLQTVMSHDALCDGLVESHSARQRWTAHIWQVQRFQHIGEGPVLARRAMNQGNDDLWPLSAQGGQQIAVEIQHKDLISGISQGLGQAAP